MPDWMDKYNDTNDLNEKYKILREEITRLRGRRDDAEFFNREAVADTVSELDSDGKGDLIVFVANDFGTPLAYRPEGSGLEVQDAVRRAILESKYDNSHPDLNMMRRTILEEHPGVHKAIIAEIDGSSLRYHLPEGSNDTTNFITVREMVGLIDYTTNSHQNEGLSKTY